MSKFSNKLKEMFSLKSVDKRIVAQSLNIERALLYRYMNDQSFPESTDFVEQLKNELYLTPYEYKELAEAYEITKLGENIYLNRQIVSGILEDLFRQEEVSFSSSYPAFDSHDKTYLTLTDRDTVYSTLQAIIMDSRSEEVLMNLQPDREFVCKSIFQMLKQKVTVHNVKIEHLLRFQSKTSEEVNAYNLMIFSKLIPLLYYCTYYTMNTYQANYYYNNQAAVDERAMDLFPNILVTPWCTIVMSFDYDNGIVYLGEEISSIYRKNFEAIKNNTFSFVHTNLAAVKPGDISERCRNTPYKDYIFKPHPSASIGLTPEFYTSKYIQAEEASPEFFTSLTDYHLKIDKIMYGDTHEIRMDFFTASGLRNFIDTGKLNTFFSDYCLPLEPKDIIDFLERYVQIIESNPRFEAHMIQDDIPDTYHGSFGIYIFNGSSLVIENSRRRVYNIASVIEVTEKSIVNAFYDFLNSSMNTSFTVLGCTETLSLLKQKVSQLKDRLASSGF